MKTNGKANEDCARRKTNKNKEEKKTKKQTKTSKNKEEKKTKKERKKKDKKTKNNQKQKKMKASKSKMKGRRFPKLFLADAMLGKLVRWLRLLGIKVLYAKELGIIEDDEIIKKVLQTKAVFITRDEKLAEKTSGYAPTLFIKSNYLREQLREFFKAFKTRLPKNTSLSICPLCGGKLKRVRKESVRGEVFPRVYERARAFWRCENKKCKQLYWKGTHVTEIRRLLKTIR